MKRSILIVIAFLAVSVCSSQNIAFPLKFKMTKNTLVDFGDYSVTKEVSQDIKYTITKEKIIGFAPIIGKNILEREICKVVSSKDEDGSDVLVFQTTQGKNGINEYIILIHKKEVQRDKYILKTPMFDAKTGDIFGYIIEEN